MIGLEKAIRQMNAASEDYDMATWTMVGHLEALGRKKDAFDAIDDISLKRSGSLRERKEGEKEREREGGEVEKRREGGRSMRIIEGGEVAEKIVREGGEGKKGRRESKR